MANSNEEQKLISKPKKKPICKLTLLAAIGAIIALIFALFAAFTAKNLTQSNTTLKATIQELQERLSKNEASYSSFAQTQTNLKNQVKALNKNLEATLQQQRYQKNDWLLLRARYYLELAEINAHWGGNQEATIVLLEQADRILSDVPEQKIYRIRQAIAKELAQFKSLPQIDITGLLSQLDAAQNSILHLPIKQPFSQAQKNEVKKEASSDNSTWRARFKQSMNALEKLIVVRRNESDMLSLISPLHQTLLCDSIRLNLQEAEWAILQNNPTIYQQTLAQALTTIKNTFDEKDSGTQALIKQLETLKQVQLVNSKPVIEESLSLLNQWIDAKKSPIADSPEGDKTK